MPLVATYFVTSGEMAWKPGWNCPYVLCPSSEFFDTSMSVCTTSAYSSSESASSKFTTMRLPSFDSAWQPKQVAFARLVPATPVICSSGTELPKACAQMLPPTPPPPAVMLDFQ